MARKAKHRKVTVLHMLLVVCIVAVTKLTTFHSDGEKAQVQKSCSDHHAVGCVCLLLATGASLFMFSFKYDMISWRTHISTDEGMSYNVIDHFDLYTLIVSAKPLFAILLPLVLMSRVFVLPVCKFTQFLGKIMRVTSLCAK